MKEALSISMFISNGTKSLSDSMISCLEMQRKSILKLEENSSKVKTLKIIKNGKRSALPKV